MADLYPLTVRGPITGSGQGVVTFARLFTKGDRLYIAESRDKGRTVTRVTSYPLPEDKPSRPGRAAKWGPWTYSSCGCANRWRTHTTDSLAQLADKE